MRGPFCLTILEASACNNEETKNSITWHTNHLSTVDGEANGVDGAEYLNVKWQLKFREKFWKVSEQELEALPNTIGQDQ